MAQNTCYFLTYVFLSNVGFRMFNKVLQVLALTCSTPIYNAGVIVGLSTMTLPPPPRDGIDIDISSSLWGTNTQKGTSACWEGQMK